MEIIKTIALLLVSCFLFCNADGQTRLKNDCANNLKGYISDIQQYTIKTNGDTKLDVVFYAGFDYRFGLCSDYKDIKLNFTLIDEMGNKHYENVISYGFFRDFKFETVFHGTITITPVNIDKSMSELIIGYKRI